MDVSIPTGPHNENLSPTRYMLVEDFLFVSLKKIKIKKGQGSKKKIHRDYKKGTEVMGRIRLGKGI